MVIERFLHKVRRSKFKMAALTAILDSGQGGKTIVGSGVKRKRKKEKISSLPGIEPRPLSTFCETPEP